MNIYVVIAENDKTHLVSGEEWKDDRGPIVFEQYVNEASFKNVVQRAKELSKKYGVCRIAKVETTGDVFIDGEQT